MRYSHPDNFPNNSLDTDLSPIIGSPRFSNVSFVQIGNRNSVNIIINDVLSAPRFAYWEGSPSRGKHTGVGADDAK